MARGGHVLIQARASTPGDEGILPMFKDHPWVLLLILVSICDPACSSSHFREEEKVSRGT